MKTNQIKSLALVLMFLWTNQTIAILPKSGLGARSTALGNSSITLTDFWSQYNNQAGLANNSNFKIGSSYENRFLLKSLSIKTIGVLIPVVKGSFGLNIIHFGDPNYNEMNIGLGYGRKLSKNLSVGIQFDYFTVKQGNDYGSKSTITFEGGFIYTVDEKIKIGGHLYNPHFKSNTDNHAILPEIYRLGLEYLINKDLTAYFEAKNQSDLGSSLHFGIEYIYKSFVFRSGYASNPDQFTFGFGFHKKQLSLDFSSTIHSVLGYTPQLSLIYTFQR